MKKDRTEQERQAMQELQQLGKKARAGDGEAIRELRLIGNILALVGGVDAMINLQDMAHDYAIDEMPRGYNYTSDMLSSWECIEQWAKD